MELTLKMLLLHGGHREEKFPSLLYRPMQCCFRMANAVIKNKDVLAELTIQ